MPKSGAKEISDLTELRALAHPVRVELLKALYSRGEANVSELAETVGGPVNQVSYHLRQLAKYDFIEPAQDRARDSRDRWWRPSYDDGVDWDPLLKSPATAPAARAQLSKGLGDSLEAIRDYFSRAVGGLPEWPEGSFAHDLYLHVTPQEAAEFDRDYLELCRQWQKHSQVRRGRGSRKGRREVSIFIYGFPSRETP